MLSCLGSRCWTRTKAIPVSLGRLLRRWVNASSPPAEAPTPTTRSGRPAGSSIDGCGAALPVGMRLGEAAGGLPTLCTLAPTFFLDRFGRPAGLSATTGSAGAERRRTLDFKTPDKDLAEVCEEGVWPGFLLPFGLFGIELSSELPRAVGGRPLSGTPDGQVQCRERGDGCSTEGLPWSGSCGCRK